MRPGSRDRNGEGDRERVSGSEYIDVSASRMRQMVIDESMTFSSLQSLCGCAYQTTRCILVLSVLQYDTAGPSSTWQVLAIRVRQYGTCGLSYLVKSDIIL